MRALRAVPRGALRRRPGPGAARPSARSSTGTARGRGCDICKPVDRLDPGQPRHSGHVLDGEPAALQDTNDHVLANLQKDGTYSVVPAHPRRRDHPGEAHRDRRGRRATSGSTPRSPAASGSTCSAPGSSSCPAIWKRLVDAGFESGHAYGKSLRTVKSCVGSTWCRYGVQDSVGLAIALELRYRGLRSPAQAQARRLRLRPRVRRGPRQGRRRHRHRRRAGTCTSAATAASPRATPSCSPRTSTTETLVRTIDRFLMYYVRTADRLQRTAALGRGARGRARRHPRRWSSTTPSASAPTSTPPWPVTSTATATSGRPPSRTPRRCARFVSFVNAPDQPDDTLVYVSERGQPRPATDSERTGGAVLIAGTTLEVRR